MLKKALFKLHQHAVKQAPEFLALPCTLLPFFIQKKLLAQLLAHLFKEAMEDDELAFLEGKWLKVEITDLHLTWFLSLAEGQLLIQEDCPQVDVTFAANVNELILIAGRKEDPDTLFFQRRLSIQGDTELGLEVKNLLDNIDHDSLPAAIKHSIHYFSTFVQQGLQPEASALNAI
ncbi:lipid carrier protein [Psychromonas sp. CNPT3]|uniref:ubiquinone anaerobic biosynthesis accessory factor UbiT n=1 Tax=Psychromonas sp. CNPT3 TaxID=314282 RepID=UPI00006E481C|nr:SCP2 sterol-binding domain-containing protein [Psychromonas sp. CNPT3]AGH81224.1 lipid carrier protein [Psychromonas sp. CNPT3]